MAVDTVFTIGHSVRPLESFLTLLEREGIARLADVRRFPMSRRHPHFNRPALEASLAGRGIDYVHLEAMGGRRDAPADLPPTGWRVAAFNAYAHHMRTPSFRAALDRLDALARERPTAVMCAEAVPWRCHRNLVSDALVARGWEVRHILDAGTSVHELAPFATVEDGEVVYGPARQPQVTMFDEDASRPRAVRPRRSRPPAPDR